MLHDAEMTSAGEANMRKKSLRYLMLVAGACVLSASATFAKEGGLEVEAGAIGNNHQAFKICETAKKEWHSNNPHYDDVRWTGRWRTIPGSAGAVCGMRYISRSDWTSKALDDRSVTPSEIVWGCTKENGITNGWINDDKCGNQLVMKTSQLDRVTTLDSAKKVSSLLTGRYIFVLSRKGNALLVRTYDRSHVLKGGTYGWCDYDQNLYAVNRKTIRNTRKRHVRHSQLNGGWDDVWSAGETWVQDGKIIAISNESGHFKPSAASLRYVQETLQYLDVPVADMKLYGVQENRRELDQLKRRCIGGKKRKR